MWAVMLFSFGINVYGIKVLPVIQLIGGICRESTSSDIPWPKHQLIAQQKMSLFSSLLLSHSFSWLLEALQISYSKPFRATEDTIIMESHGASDS